MIELPESNTLARQINEILVGKRITSVQAGASPHKFAWYHGGPADYAERLVNNHFISARGVGIFVEITLSKVMLLFSDGVNQRWHPSAGPIPKKHQLLLGLDDDTFFSASLSMYGGLYCWEHKEPFENFYYTVALEKPSPLTERFDLAYFSGLLSPTEVQSLSLKAALATKQSIPGLGNGCLQDILWQAHLHPKRKTSTLTEDEIQALFSSLKNTLAEMARQGGRATEKDLFGKPGGYPVVMCAASKGQPCPQCGTPIFKEAFMGGSIYTCRVCQPLDAQE
ncbi:MAG: endonuclease VIII [Chloroflexi bacterium]|jgi:formamidopyrimidine-DNA glycosylase|nr:endonuclease VIII [Chloroflexota bacterium]